VRDLSENVAAAILGSTDCKTQQSNDLRPTEKYLLERVSEVPCQLAGYRRVNCEKEEPGIYVWLLGCVRRLV
jgi:hypothetical protein